MTHDAAAPRAGDNERESAPQSGSGFVPGPEQAYPPPPPATEFGDEPPAYPPSGPAPVARPGPLSVLAWILYFSIELAIVYVPYFLGPEFRTAAIPEPGVLDDPRMIVAGVASSWFAFLVAALLAWRARLTRIDLGLVGLRAGRLLAWTGFCLLGLFAVWMGASVFLGDKLRIIEPLTRPPQGLGHWLLWLALAATAGLTEEYVMRGYGIGFLARLGANRWAAAVGMSVLFGALHLYQGWHAVPLLILWGFVFAVAYLRTGSIWPGVVAHFLVDATAPLLLGPTPPGAP